MCLWQHTSTLFSVYQTQEELTSQRAPGPLPTKVRQLRGPKVVRRRAPLTIDNDSSIFSANAEEIKMEEAKTKTDKAMQARASETPAVSSTMWWQTASPEEIKCNEMWWLFKKLCVTMLVSSRILSMTSVSISSGTHASNLLAANLVKWYP